MPRVISKPENANLTSAISDISEISVISGHLRYLCNQWSYFCRARL